MRARRPRFYNLKKPKVRQSWNKFNLYNLARASLQRGRFSKTFFQQKWKAKAMTRSYHGAHIKESDWERMFSRRLLSSVEVDPGYLAAHDGSEQAAGRGSGKQLAPGESPVTAGSFSVLEQRRRSQLGNGDHVGDYAHTNSRRFIEDGRTQLLARPVRDMTPYMHMTYAPLERRLDTAIFRALFASSTLQARQLCVHGHVTVNGKKMRYPAYPLNPGDMFQVDVESVLFATGQPKNPKETARLAKMIEQREQRDAAIEAEEAAIRIAKKKELADKLEIASSERGGGTSVQAEASEQASADTPVEAETAAIEEEEGDGEPMTEEELQVQHKRQLKRLIKDAKEVLKEKDNSGMSAKQKQRVRLFLAEAKRVISRMGTKKQTDTDDLDLVDSEQATLSRNAVMDQLAGILKGLSLDQVQEKKTQEAEAEAEAQEGEADQPSPKSPHQSVQEQVLSLSSAEQEALAELLRQDAANPVDESKPYLTPWQPRNYMSAFAFIPRYLEVNQNICAAVYLRHPVARRGLAEVPTPFPYETSQLAFNWYLRRR